MDDDECNTGDSELELETQTLPSEELSLMLEVLPSWSKQQLKEGLLKRGEYKKRLSHAQLVTRLGLVLRRESRLDRLQEAIVADDRDEIQRIRHEAVKDQRRKSQVPPPTELGYKRTVFMSVVNLNEIFQEVPDRVLENAFFVFDSDRSWIHTPTDPPIIDDLFDVRYIHISTRLKEIITFKEEAGMCYWHRPEKDFKRLSSMFAKIDDPITGNKYHPVQVAPNWWRTLGGHLGEWDGPACADGQSKHSLDEHPRFIRQCNKMASILASGSFDHIPVMEILHQSNRTLEFIR